MFTVQFKNWQNNWSQMDSPETYPTLAEAQERADRFYSFENESMGNNCYNRNGCETWIEDSQGNRVTS